jgi:hypothetical protein
LGEDGNAGNYESKKHCFSHSVQCFTTMTLSRTWRGSSYVAMRKSARSRTFVASRLSFDDWLTWVKGKKRGEYCEPSCSRVCRGPVTRILVLYLTSCCGRLGQLLRGVFIAGRQGGRTSVSVRNYVWHWHLEILFWIDPPTYSAPTWGWEISCGCGSARMDGSVPAQQLPVFDSVCTPHFVMFTYCLYKSREVFFWLR